MDLKVGERVASVEDESIGTIRWIGELEDPNLKGTWIGIEWDSEGRGKHSGSYQNRKYFECKRENHGSFIKREKVKVGISVSKALLEKYIENANNKENEELYILDAKTNHSKKFEIVGLEETEKRQQHFENATAIMLDHRLLSSLGDSSIIQRLSSLSDLDLSYNLFCELGKLSELATLPKLKVLNLSNNYFSSFSLSDSFQFLRTLVLNSTSITWKTVLRLGINFPQLEELHVCFNSITLNDENNNNNNNSNNNNNGKEEETKLEHNNSYSNLKLLNIQFNDINDWNCVRKLNVYFPKLEQLLLSNNQLKKIEKCNEEEFQNLTSLSITNNQIEDWESVENLNSFKKLNSLRFTPNPLISEIGVSISRQILTARLPLISKLNGSEIRKADREEAEKFYVRWAVTVSKSQNPETDSKLHQQNPRFIELTKKWTMPPPFQPSSTLSDEMISVVLVNRGVEIKKQVPSSLSVSNLKLLASKLFSIPASSIVLFYKENKNVPFPEELKDETRSLSFFAIKSNSEIVVSESN